MPALSPPDVMIAKPFAIPELEKSFIANNASRTRANHVTKLHEA
jgi:hypothetical protein